MARLVYADRVKESTTSTGTGTISLLGNAANHVKFVTGVGTGLDCYYTIEDAVGQAWEVGIGTVTAGSPDTLSRTTVLASSNAGALVNFGSGTKTVWCDFPAAAMPFQGADIASAAALNIGNAGTYFNVTGATGPITSITPTRPQGTVIDLKFASTPTVTNNANIITLTGANKVVSAGETMRVVSEGGGVYRELGPTDRWPVNAQTGTYSQVIGDRFKLIKCTNTFTLTLLAAATAGDGFVQAITNAGVGTITVDGNGAETIAGAATVALAAGETLIIVCDGSNWQIASKSTAASSGLTGNVPLYIWKGGALNFTQNTTRYIKAINSASTTTEADATFAMPIRCKVSELRVVANAAIPASNSFVITVRKNGADSALTATMGAAATTAQDITHTVNFEQGDLFAVKGLASATMGSGIDFGFTVLITALEGDHAAGAAGIPFIFAYATAPVAADFCGEWTESATETLVQVPMSACRIFQRSYLRHSGGTGSAFSNPKASLNAVLAVPGPPTVIGDGAGVYNGSFQVEGGTVVECADNDFFAIYLNNIAGAPTHTDIAFRLKNTDATKYAPIPMIFNTAAQAQNITRYMGSFGVGVQSATESEVQIPMPACTIRTLRGLTNVAPAAGQTIILTVRKNGVDTAVTVTITGTPSIRVQADTSNSVAFAAGDLFSIKAVTSATSGTLTCTAAVEPALT